MCLRVLISVFAVSVASLALSGVCSAADTDNALDKMLATKTLADGWAQTGDAKQYDKKTLFQLIDGEAELYFPYGFTRTAALSFVRNGDGQDAVSGEIYELGSPLDAYGIFSRYRDEDTKLTPLGAEGYVDGTQAIFYQDRYFVKLRVDKMEGASERLTSCAQMVSGALPQNKAKPALADILNIEGVVPQTEQYIAESVLGYALFPKGFVAEMGTAEPRPRPFVVLGESTDAATQIVNAYVAYLDKSKAKYEWTETPGGKVLTARDPLHKGVVLQQLGDKVVGIARLTDTTAGLPLLEKLRSKASS